MKFIVPVIAAFILLLPSFSLAETKEIVAEGTYNMGDGETPNVAESRALLQAKRTAVEEAGTYVESYSKTKNFQLNADEIQVLASGVMEVEVLEKKRTVIGDGFNFWIKIKANVSTDKMEEMAKRVKEKSVVEDYKKIQEAYDKSQREIEELKRQLAGAKGDRAKKQIEAKIADDERLLQANEWFEKGYKHHANLTPLSITARYDAAIEAYTKAIALNPNYAEAYYNLGRVYTLKSYADKGQLDMVIENFNKAIELNPNLAEAYINRGNAYFRKGQHDKAIESFNKAIILNPNDANSYIYLGLAYSDKGQLDRAIENLNKAIALDPNDDLVYLDLGSIYADKGKFDRAIENYNKAIALNPDVADTYNRLGVAYAKKRDMGKAISNFQKACDLGDEDGCKALQEALKCR